MAGEVTTPSSNGSDIGAPTDKELTWQNLCLAILLCILITVTVVSDLCLPRIWSKFGVAGSKVKLILCLIKQNDMET
jgi:hypothetical protein